VILEHAHLQVRAGAEARFEEAFADARKIVAQAPGFRSLELWRGVEEPATYRLLIVWDSVEAHLHGFRESPLYTRWSSLLRPHFAEPPEVDHAAPVTTNPRRS